MASGASQGEPLEVVDAPIGWLLPPSGVAWPLWISGTSPKHFPAPLSKRLDWAHDPLERFRNEG
jgi:hypothetical protein